MAISDKFVVVLLKIIPCARHRIDLVTLRRLQITARSGYGRKEATPQCIRCEFTGWRARGAANRSASATFLRKAFRSVICCLRASTKTARNFGFLVLVVRGILLMGEAPSLAR
jgi:hypothetical protein